MQTYLQPGHNRGAVPGGEGQALAAGFLQQVVSEESGSELNTDIFVWTCVLARKSVSFN